LVSDNDIRVTSIEFKQAMVSLHITHRTTVTCRPQTNGLAEAANKVIATTFTRLLADGLFPSAEWSDWTWLVELQINSRYCHRLNGSPCQLLYGYNPPPITSPLTPSADFANPSSLRRTRQIQKCVTDILQDVANTFREGSFGPPPTFVPGDLVMVPRKFLGDKKGLATPFVGPFPVIRQKGTTVAINMGPQGHRTRGT
jgi:hypothetical protein